MLVELPDEFVKFPSDYPREIGAFLAGLLWSHSQNTDGRLPGRFVEWLDGTAERFTTAELVRLGLWEETANGSHRIVDFERWRRRSVEQDERKRLTRQMRENVFARDGRVCRACGVEDDLHIDHIQPIAAGGRSVMSNLQVLCRTCNLSKGATWDG